MRSSAARLVRSLVLVAVLGLLGTGATLLITGRAAVVVTHGVSMNPVYYEGDLVIVARTDSYRVGDIAAYHDRAHDLVALHRIIAGNAAGFTFKGDNNQSVDLAQPAGADLIGRAVVDVPGAGRWLGRLTSAPALGATALALTAGGGTATSVHHRRRRMRRSTVPRHAARPARSLPRLRAASPSLRAPAAAAAVTTLLGVALGAVAWSGPAATAVTTVGASSQSMTFSYSASVPRSPAYDGTTARSPDPVFRKLAQTVDVHLDYRGGPGTIAVTGELLAPSGWRASLPLAAEAAFATTAYAGDVRLDLAALDARAQAAATATGVPVSQLSFRVVADVGSTDGSVFRPGLTLSLTPLQLALPGGPASLTSSASTPTTTSTTMPRRLTLLGHAVSVVTARTAALVLLLLGLLGSIVTGVLLLTTRRSGTSEGAGIRQRYAAILVAVHPVASAPGRPVVDVTSFATLARLAQRYGLLVLHWSRSGVETFLVQDENTTYRYRTGDSRPDAPPRSAVVAAASTSTCSAPAAPAAPVTAA